jgi:hypothetical protein
MVKNKKKKEEKKKSKEISFVVSKMVEFSNKDEFEQQKDKLVEELEELDYEVSDHVDDETVDDDGSNFDEEDEEEEEELEEDDDDID